MVRRLGSVGTLWFCTVLLFTGCSIISAKEAAKPELLKPVKQQVELLEVKRGTVSNEINDVGVLIPAVTQFLTYTMDGKLAEIYVKQGDRVHKGDPLFRLENPVDKDKGDLIMQIFQQKLTVETMKAAFQKSKKNNDINDIKISGLNLDIEQIRLESLTNKLNSLKLVSTVDGVVTFIDAIRPGNSLSAYRNIIGIADSSAIRVKYIASNAQAITQVELGMEVEVTFHGQKYKAKVTQTPANVPVTIGVVESAKQKDINSKTIIFDFEDIPQNVEFGENAEFRLVINEKKNIIKIPRVALRSYQGRDFVHIQENDARKEIDVEKGIYSATEVEITKGLREGQKLILNN